MNTLRFLLCSSLGSVFARLGYSLSIDGSSSLFRLLYSPRMGDSVASLVKESVFDISTDQPESLIWDRFAPYRSFVDHLGLRVERQSRSAPRPKRYIGFLSATAEKIISYRTRAGFGFALTHDPSEGLHHVHISFFSDSGSKPSKSERAELRLALMQYVFVDAHAYVPQS